MSESKNFILFAVLSLGILVGYQALYLGPKEAERQRYEQQQREALGETIQPPATTAASTPADSPAVIPTSPAYEDAGRVDIDTPELSGSISLRGARIDDLILNNHRISSDIGSDNIHLLRKLNEANAYFVRFGWTAKDKNSDFVPGPATAWRADGTLLTPETPVTLSWTNDAQVTFAITFAIDDQFMFTVDQSVRNGSGEAIEVAPYGLINREGQPETDGLYILHEGAIGVFNSELKELTYSDLEDDGNFETSTTGGWMGITDKFWMTALIPDQNASLPVARVARRVSGPEVSYRVEYTENWQAVAAGNNLQSSSKLYAGAKIVGAIDDYAERYQIDRFDLAIDWGWFWFLTKPIFAVIHMLFEATGNFGVAILLMTVILKVGLFWFANKSYVSMAHMRRAQPKIKALQERYGDDRAEMQKAMMELYKKEKINPMAGCLPMIPQMFIFFALYKVLYVTIEMRHQPFFGWITDLSAPDPLTPVNLFGLLPFDPPGIIAVGLLPILMGVSMWLQQKLNPQTSMDPTQQKVMSMLPIIFTFVMAQFSAGLVLYWTWNNILSIAQQWVIMRREDARMDEAKA